MIRESIIKLTKFSNFVGRDPGVKLEYNVKDCYDVVYYKRPNKPVRALWVLTRYDNNGKILYAETSHKSWEKFEYDDQGNLIFCSQSDETWQKMGYDSNQKRVYYEESSGYWEKMVYNEQGKLTYTEDSTGSWQKREYNDRGALIYLTNDNGYWEKITYEGTKIHYEDSLNYKTCHDIMPVKNYIKKKYGR